MDPGLADLVKNWLIHFKILKAAGTTKRAKILSSATEDGLLKRLYMLSRNLYYDKAQLTPREKSRLACYKKELKQLGGARISAEGRRKLLLKHERCGDRGLLTAILTPWIRLLKRNT